MEIEYKTPNLKNMPEIMGIMPLLYNEIGEGLSKVLEEFVESEAYFKLLAVERGTGAVAGFMVGCCRLEVDFECRAGIIEEIVVLPAYRKLGIGKNMLAEFEKWSVTLGAKGLLVPCGREGFYEKMGFEKGVIKRYWKEFK